MVIISLFDQQNMLILRYVHVFFLNCSLAYGLCISVVRKRICLKVVIDREFKTSRLSRFLKGRLQI